jgi:hypothetical protein
LASEPAEQGGAYEGSLGSRLSAAARHCGTRGHVIVQSYRTVDQVVGGKGSEVDTLSESPLWPPAKPQVVTPENADLVIIT